MYLVAFISTTVFLGACVLKLMSSTKEESLEIEITNEWRDFSSSWDVIYHNYLFPCISVIVGQGYVTYTRCSLINVSIFILKYVPTGIFAYKSFKNMYKSSLERIRQKQMEIEEIEFQIEMVKTKLSGRDAELTERLEQVRKSEERLRDVRAKVQAAIAAARGTNNNTDINKLHDDRYIIELLKDMKYEEILGPMNVPTKIENIKMECGEHAQTEFNTPEGSVYSSISEGDLKKDCVVKIVKVTNVYKVAYLKHFIKQKRLRSATRQALFKKKIESVNSLLQDWQRSLNYVIHREISHLYSRDVAPRDNIGDYYNQPSQDLDSERLSEFGYDESANTSNCHERDMEDPAMCCDCANPAQVYYTNPQHFVQECQDRSFSCQLLFIPEETSSQIAIEEITDKHFCNDRKMNIT